MVVVLVGAIRQWARHKALLPFTRIRRECKVHSGIGLEHYMIVILI